MDYERFITIVEQLAMTDRDGAERAMRATLQTLGERIVREELRQVASMLPPEVAPWLNVARADAEPFDVDEFLRRIAAREQDGDLVTAERDARAVLAALGQAIDPGELANMAAQLSKDYAPLLPRGRPDVHVLPADAFLQRVADRARLDMDGARRATDALLETLAERIAAGEVEDLISRLPVALHPPLKRGVQQGGEQARAMPVERFLMRAAEREGVSLTEEPRHARAVFTTLHEAIGDDEFFDVTVQLPDDYMAVLAR